jgi:NitT/TauT family transport system substrate-binding protein
MGHLHEWVANDLGIYQANGLDVDDQLVSGSAVAMAALVSGQTSFSTGSSDAISAIAEGADLVVLAVEIPVYTYLLEVPPSIKTVADLKGAKIGVDSYGSAPDVGVRVALRKAGLDPDKDVSILAVGNVPTRATALIQGAIQGTLLNPPSSLTVEDKGFHPLLNLAKQNLPNGNGSTIGQRSWVNANRATVQKYIDSLVVADQRLRKDKPGTVELMKKHLKSDDQRGMEAAYDFYVGDVYPVAPFPKPEQFADSVAELAKKNPKIKDVDINKVLDPSFVQSAVDRGLTKS